MPTIRNPWTLPVITGLAAAVVYLCTMQAAYFDDGIRFDFRLRNGPLTYIHILYLPLVAGFRGVVSWFVPLEPEWAMKIVSALAGGLGVGLTCRIAAVVTGSQRCAVAAAVLLAGSIGYWFHATATELHSVHAAGACVLLLGLVLALRSPDTAPKRVSVLLAIGAFLTPGTHASGIASGFAGLVLLWFSRRARRPYFLALAGGYGLFLAIYLALYFDLFAVSDFRGYSLAQSQKLGILIDHPELLVGKLQAVAGDFLLFTIPASVLAPAGWWWLRRENPHLAALLLVWTLAWPILAIPVGDRAWGSNFVTTFPVQSIFAILALRHLSTSALRAAGVAALSLVPTAVMISLAGTAHVEIFGLGAWLVCATTLFILGCRDRDAGRLKGFGLLSISLLVFACNAYYIDPGLKEDAIRDRLRAVQAAAGENDLVICLASNPNNHLLWVRFFPDAERRYLNPYLIEALPNEKVAGELIGYQARVDTALADGRGVWLVRLWPGSPENHLEPTKNQALGGFLGGLLSRYRWVETSIPGVLRLEAP